MRANVAYCFPVCVIGWHVAILQVRSRSVLLYIQRNPTDYQGRGPHHGRPTSTFTSTQLPELCSVLCNVSMRQGRCINNDPIPLTVRISVGLHGSCCRRGVVASVHVAGVGIQGVRKEHVTDVLGGQHTRGGRIVPVRHPAGFVGEPGCRRVVLVSHGAHVFISRLEAVQHCTVISRLKAVRHQ